MRIRLAGLVVLPGLLAVACSDFTEAPVEAAPIEAVAEDRAPAVIAASTRMDTGDSDPVPEALLGTWVYSHFECDADILAGMDYDGPEVRDIRAQITFLADRTYGMDVEGFPFSGNYRYEAGEYPRITLDNLLNFNVVENTLQNWSEGDATYVCGRIFMREGA